MTPSDAGRSAGDPYDLTRFVHAQAGTYERALAELQGARSVRIGCGTSSRNLTGWVGC